MDADIPSGGRRHFLLVSSARSGSSLLRGLLKNHPQLKCRGELLGEDKLIKHGIQNAPKDEILSYLSGKLSGDKHSVVGFKILLGNLKDTGIRIRDVLKLMTQPKVIFLYRKNMLETFASLLIAKKNNIWYSTNEVNTESVTVTWEELLTYTGTCRELWCAVQTEVEELIEADDQAKLTYDDLSHDMVGVTQRLLEFLGLQQLDWEPEHNCVKQNPGKMEDKIVNYTEICKLAEEHNLDLTLTL